MKTATLAFAGVLLTVPVGVTAQQAGGWWAPLAESLPAAQQDRGLICSMVPDLPACDGDVARDRTDDGPWEQRRDDDGRDRDDDDRWERDDDDRRERARGRRGGDDQGPPFCRNGQGHPVFGMEWCRDKGFGRAGRNDIGWRDVGWEDVVLGRRDGRVERERLDRGGLVDVLGSVVLGRLESQGRRLDAGALTGRFVEGRTRVLQVRAGNTPLAELMDADRDGRVDRILLRAPR